MSRSLAISYTVPLEDGEAKIRLYLYNEQLLRNTWVANRHCNADYELHVLLGGKCTLDVEDTHYELSGGEAVFIAPGKYHKPHSCVGEIARISLEYSFSEGALLSALQGVVPQSRVFVPTADFIYCCKELIAENVGKKPLQESAQQALLMMLTISLLRSLDVVKYVEPDRRKREELERTQLIDCFFEKIFHKRNGEKCGCEDLARELHLSKRQLLRVLKEHYGMNFQEKRIHAKMDNAAFLLRTTDAKIQTIIETVGYSSAAPFYKAFFARFGMKPQAYRSTYKKK